MNKILVAKSTTYGAKIGGGVIADINETNQLLDGAIAIFSETGVLLTAANVVASMADKKRIYIAVGSGSATQGADIAEMIPRLKTNFIKKDYVAPAKVRQFIGSNGTSGDFNEPATLVAGTEAFVRITDLSSGLLTTGQDTKRYSEVVLEGDTITTVMTRLIAQINADVDAIVTATAVGAITGVQLDAKNFSVNFAISLDGILISATTDSAESPVTGTSAAVALNEGSGTYTQVLATEKLFSPQMGNTNKIMQPDLWYSRGFKAVSGATYDLYNIAWMGKKPHTVNGDMNTIAMEVIVALPDGATSQAAVEAVFAEVFGNAETEETGA